MYDIVVGIPTYKRTKMLKKLLISILHCHIDRLLIKNINIIIIDNDVDETGKKVVENLKTMSYNDYKISYYNYPVKGLSNVRNELFKKALLFSPDYILCMDDDEYATPDWLNELVLAITTSKSEIVQGQVIPVFEKQTPCYMATLFKYSSLKNHQRVDFFSTCNFAISTKFLLQHKLEFDLRFNKTGSEDSYFGIKAKTLGAKITWAEHAIVYETIPTKRASLKWLIKRKYNGAITFTYILILEKDYFGLIKKLFINIIYLLIGGLGLLVMPFQFKWKYWGILKMSESVGGFAGLLGVKYHEYAKDRKFF